LSSELELANHCSQRVAAMLGPWYARIVRKCLGCDFGEDVDLGRNDLKIAVHRDVVLELKGLVENFQGKMAMSG
jgi:hypothetical protein